MVTRTLAWAIAIGLAAGACGGGSSAPSSPTQPSGGVTPTNVVTITTAGVSPKNIVVSQGAQVTFTNNDTQNHMIFSNPHPEHTDCPEINQVGFISPGQSKQTGNMNTVRVCGYHDHDLPTDVRWQGTITIQ